MRIYERAAQSRSNARAMPTRPPQSPGSPPSDASPDKHRASIASAQGKRDSSAKKLDGKRQRKQQSRQLANHTAAAAVNAGWVASNARAKTAAAEKAAASARVAAEEAAAEQAAAERSERGAHEKANEAEAADGERSLSQNAGEEEVVDSAAKVDRRTTKFVQSLERQVAARKKEQEAAQDRERSGTATVADGYIDAERRGHGAAVGATVTRTGFARGRRCVKPAAGAAGEMAVVPAASAPAEVRAIRQILVEAVEVGPADAKRFSNAGRKVGWDAKRRPGRRMPVRLIEKTSELKKELKSFHQCFQPGGKHHLMVKDWSGDELRLYSGKVGQVSSLVQVLQGHLLLSDADGAAGDLVNDASHAVVHLSFMDENSEGASAACRRGNSRRSVSPSCRSV